ncbi:CvpA family protein [Roseivirga sp. BDSF3-8]|uniref:CvpA family protein n=1 Tax=Roseivirga sp. BDSF3-8 TaxID=3241598 RepID=UPI003531B29C
MNTLDIILLVLLVIGAVEGYRKGLLISIFGFIGLVLAVIGSIKLLDVAQEWLIAMLEKDAFYVPVLAFALIFIGILLTVTLLGRGLKKLIDLTPLGLADNVAGAILGAVKWCFAVGFLLWLFDMMHFDLPANWKEGSVVYPIVMVVTTAVIDILSGAIPFIKEMSEKLDDIFRAN